MGKNEYYATLRTPANITVGMQLDISSLQPYPQYSKTRAYVADSLMRLSWLSAAIDPDLNYSAIIVRYIGPELDFSNYRSEFCLFGEKSLEAGTLEILEIITLDNPRLKPEILHDVIFQSTKELDAQAKEHRRESVLTAIKVLSIHQYRNTPNTPEAFNGKELKRLAHVNYLNVHKILHHLELNYPDMYEEYQKERQEFKDSPLGKLQEELNRSIRL